MMRCSCRMMKLLSTATVLALAVYSIPTLLGQDEKSSGSLTDERDGNTYRTMRIGRTLWMAENLRYKAEASWCFDCRKNGRHYSFAAALKACPHGWQLPSEADWRNLLGHFGKTPLGELGSRYYGFTGVADDLLRGGSSGFEIPLAGIASLKTLRLEGEQAYYWSARELSDRSAYGMTFGRNAVDSERRHNMFFTFYGRESGYCVRCVRAE